MCPRLIGDGDEFLVCVRQFDDVADEVECLSDHGGQLVNVDGGCSIKNLGGNRWVDVVEFQESEDLAGILSLGR